MTERYYKPGITCLSLPKGKGKSIGNLFCPDCCYGRSIYKMVFNGYKYSWFGLVKEPTYIKEHVSCYEVEHFYYKGAVYCGECGALNGYCNMKRKRKKRR